MSVERGVCINLSGLNNINVAENVRAFFPKEQSKLSVVMRCPY